MNKTSTVEIADGESVWVIDGQHRINGMKSSNQPMPFVLLYDERPSHQYSGAYLAELFSIVTTKAKPMEGIHKEWMSYAFQLDKYASKNKRTLMEIGIELATTTNFGDGHANENLFYGQIQFNDAISVEGDVVGFFVHDSKPRENIGFQANASVVEQIYHGEHLSGNFGLCQCASGPSRTATKGILAVWEIRERPVHVHRRGVDGSLALAPQRSSRAPIV